MYVIILDDNEIKEIDDITPYMNLKLSIDLSLYGCSTFNVYQMYNFPKAEELDLVDVRIMTIINLGFEKESSYYIYNMKKLNELKIKNRNNKIQYIIKQFE